MSLEYVIGVMEDRLSLAKWCCDKKTTAKCEESLKALGAAQGAIRLLDSLVKRLEDTTDTMFFNRARESVEVWRERNGRGISVGLKVKQKTKKMKAWELFNAEGVGGVIVFAPTKGQAKSYIMGVNLWYYDTEYTEIVARRAPFADHLAGDKIEEFVFCDNARQYKVWDWDCSTKHECDKEECPMKKR